LGSIGGPFAQAHSWHGESEEVTKNVVLEVLQDMFKSQTNPAVNKLASPRNRAPPILSCLCAGPSLLGTFQAPGGRRRFRPYLPQ
jgi:hypothetical protein